MKTKHTPGPWTYSLIGERPIIHCGWQTDGRTPNNWESTLSRVSAETERANTLLISAAPDMFEALSQALALLQDPDASEFDANRVEQLLISALNKARGES